MNSRPMLQNAMVAVAAAITVSILGWVWNEVSNGAIIRALGGITREQISHFVREELLQDKKIREALKGPEGKQGKEGRQGEPGRVGIATFPKGAVVAFDLEGGCPEGWDIYRHASGRFIVGQGRHSLNDEYGTVIEKLPFGHEGGKRRHKLTIPEMPMHDHQLIWGQGRGADYRKITGSNILFNLNVHRLKQNTEPRGDGTPHEIMPPYKVLVFCWKE